MTSEKATERKLIFINLLNGVDVKTVAQTFRKESEKEVMDEFRFVALKIKNYAFQRVMPHIPCDTVAEARANKIIIFGILEKINLDVVPIFKAINSTSLENIL